MTGRADPVPETPEVPVVPAPQTRPPKVRTRPASSLLEPSIPFLLGVIVIVGGLIYFPMLILGPIGERISG